MSDERKPVDLERVRRARAALDRVLHDHPELRHSERTARYLAGKLEGGPMADERTDKPVRVPIALWQRAETLVDILEAHGDPELFAWRKPSATAVIRLALSRGLDVLEREHEQSDEDR